MEEPAWHIIDDQASYLSQFRWHSDGFTFNLTDCITVWTATVRDADLQEQKEKFFQDLGFSDENLLRILDSIVSGKVIAKINVQKLEDGALCVSFRRQLDNLFPFFWEVRLKKLPSCESSIAIKNSLLLPSLQMIASLGGSTECPNFNPNKEVSEIQELHPNQNWHWNLETKKLYQKFVKMEDHQESLNIPEKEEIVIEEEKQKNEESSAAAELTFSKNKKSLRLL